MPDSTRIEFATRDGVILRGDFYKAAGDGAPIVVMTSGFALLKENLVPFAQAYQAAGISALAYDHRSYGSSDGVPRQETDPRQQASDYHDAVTAAMGLPGADPSKVLIWGIGHGGTAAMIAAATETRTKAAILHVPFPSGALDAMNFPKGLLERAWRDRESKSRAGDTTPTYEKVWRDWAEDGERDDKSVFIGGPAGYGFYQSTKTAAAAAGTPWENHTTLQSFINLVATEAHDSAYRINQPCFYVVHEDDPLAAPAKVHRLIAEQIGGNCTFAIVPVGPGIQFGDQIGQAIGLQLEWLKKIL